MKFAQSLRVALETEGFPAHWVESAITYKQLKKCLNKVERELQEIGLDPETLARLTGQSNDVSSPERKGSVDARYEFDKDARSREPLPKLTLFLKIVDGEAVGAELSPATRSYLKNIAAGRHGNIDLMGDDKLPPNVPDLVEAPGMRRVEIPLKFDVEFFHTLHDEVERLDKLQEQEQESMTKEIENLSIAVTHLSAPRTFQKTDQYRWREIFDLYLNANIFFSTNELDHGKRNSATAAKQLYLFQKQIMCAGLLDLFKLKASHDAFDRFVKINVTLLKYLKFQELSQTAVTKILKKFDKTTSLRTSTAYPKFLKTNLFMSVDMSKAVCAQVSQDLVLSVPRFEDYQCPVCFNIVWRPLKMECGHFFCIRCTIEMKRMRRDKCPLCREGVILKADIDNIDDKTMAFIAKHFPKEVLAKQLEHEAIDGEKRFGVLYEEQRGLRRWGAWAKTHPDSNCAVM